MLARRAKALITVSEFSASELSQVLSVPKTRFEIVPNAADHMLRYPPRLPEWGGGKFALCVGNQTPNKNVETAIRAFLALERSDLKLVLVGAATAEIFGPVRLKDHPNIVKLGFVEDAELRALYERAEFLCFPSRYEGFGIPALEAMTLNCPVIASDAGAVREVVGDAALIRSADDVDGFSAAMRRVLDEPELAMSLRARGAGRAQHYSWDASAAKFEALLDRLNGARP
jgi:glycosyltransferase involved in cell wall biosynthesis